MSSSLRIEQHEIDEEIERAVQLATIGIDSEEALLYIDYSSERYPYATISLIATGLKHEAEEPFATYIQVTIDVRNLPKLLNKKTIELRDLVSLKVRCSHGWLVYGYGPITSREGVPYVEKRWYHLVGLALRPIEVSEELVSKLAEAITNLVHVAYEKLREEGHL